jgi:copper(I)-binding protein
LSGKNRISPARRRSSDLSDFIRLFNPARATAPRLRHGALIMSLKSPLLALALCLAASAASAHDYKIGSLSIGHPWSRATPKGATLGAGYLKITNNGSEPDRLIGGSADFAGRFEIHEMKMEGGVMKMRSLPNGIEIKPGQTVELKPGGYHLMFPALKAPLEQGKKVKGTLRFEKAGSVDVEYAVEAMGGAPKEAHHGH